MAENEFQDRLEDKGGWAETFREFALTGLAAIFMTEDAVKHYLKDLKLPKEIISLLIEGISKKKDEFYALLAKELVQVFSKVDFSQELGKFLQNHSVRVEARFSFEPKEKKKEM